MRKEKNYYVYIMASKTGTLYIGVTSNLQKRVDEHKKNLVEGFTKKYYCHRLVYYEISSNVYVAISREKQLKNWRREKKENLIKTLNPSWKDLSADL
ncbi:MAG: GIY-YIG nuclease family protein [Candidatus Pacebacteria bacterium]|nr:GIY-YIG nuclease family protein [Candidatus Paceibacterota bacterium]